MIMVKQGDTEVFVEETSEVVETVGIVDFYHIVYLRGVKT